MSDSFDSAGADNTREERIVAWMPAGRTASLVAEVLEKAGLSVVVCEEVDVFRRLVRDGAGAAFLIEEAFVDDERIDRLAKVLEEQPIWSDLPVTVFVSDAGRTLPFQRRLGGRRSTRSVMVLERPLHPEELVSVAESALRDRRRQYDLRDLIGAVRDQAAVLEERVEKQTGRLRLLAGRLTRAEQTERRRISQLLHDDLQQILYGIGMKMHMAARGADPEVGEQLEEVREWVDQAVDMTRGLTTELSPPVLEDESLTETMEWLGSHMDELHGLTVHVEAEGRHTVEDEGLRNLLFQIVRELLFNVKKHAGVPEAKVQLTGEGDQLTLQVIDEGNGFDPDGAAEEHEEGGFGLFSVKERLQLMGGRLEVHSTPGEGTRAVVRVSSDDADAASIRTRSLGEGAPQEELRIFSVDDHPVLREMLAALFDHEQDMTLCGEAQGGDEALRKIPETDPDLVLVDISLPDMSGIDVVRKLRESRSRVPVLMLSAHTGPRYVKEAFEAGAAGYVLKGDAVAIPEAVRQIARGERYVSSNLRHLAPEQAAAQQASPSVGGVTGENV